MLTITLIRRLSVFFFFFNDTATTEIYTLSLHDALPISRRRRHAGREAAGHPQGGGDRRAAPPAGVRGGPRRPRSAWGQRTRSEEHTSELQSRQYLVCRLLLEKKKKNNRSVTTRTDYTSP